MTVMTHGLLYSARISGNGNGLIRDKVSKVGVVGKYKIGLFDRNSKLLERETWSKQDGSYEFTYVEMKLYFIVAFDHDSDPLNAAIADYVFPKTMP